MATPTDDGIEIDSDNLLNIHIDYHNMREILSELSVQVDHAQRQIGDLAQQRELDVLGDRLAKLEGALQTLRDTTHSTPLSPENSENHDLTDLRESLPSLLSSLKDDTLAEADRRIHTAIDSIEFPAPSPPPALDFPSLSSFTKLVRRVDDLENSIPMPPLESGNPPEAIIPAAAAPPKSDELARIANSIAGIRQRLSALEDANDAHKGAIANLIAEQKEQVGQLARGDQLRRLLGDQLDRVQRDFGGRLDDLENRKTPPAVEADQVGAKPERREAKPPADESPLSPSAPKVPKPLREEARAPNVAFVTYIAPPIALPSVPKAEPPPVQVINQASAAVDVAGIEARVRSAVLEVLRAELQNVNQGVEGLRSAAADQQKMMNWLKKRGDGDGATEPPPKIAFAVIDGPQLHVQAPAEQARSTSPVKELLPKPAMSPPVAFARGEMEHGSPKGMAPTAVEVVRKSSPPEKVNELGNGGETDDRRMTELQSKFRSLERNVDMIARTVEQLVAAEQKKNPEGTRRTELEGPPKSKSKRKREPKDQASKAESTDQPRRPEPELQPPKTEPSNPQRKDQPSILKGETEPAKPESEVLRPKPETPSSQTKSETHQSKHEPETPSSQTKSETHQSKHEPEAPSSKSAFEDHSPIGDSEGSLLQSESESEGQSSKAQPKPEAEKLKHPPAPPRPSLEPSEPLPIDAESELSPVDRTEMTTTPIAPIRDERVDQAFEQLSQFADNLGDLRARLQAVEQLSRLADDLAQLPARLQAVEQLSRLADDLAQLPARLQAVEQLSRLADDLAQLPARLQAVEQATKDLQNVTPTSPPPQSIPEARIVSQPSTAVESRPRPPSEFPHPTTTTEPAIPTRYASFGLQTLQEIGLQVDVPVEVGVSPRPLASPSDSSSSRSPRETAAPIPENPRPPPVDVVAEFQGTRPSLPAQLPSFFTDPVVRADSVNRAHTPRSKTPMSDPRIAAHQQTIDALQVALRETRDRFLALHDQVHGLTRRCDTLERRRTIDPAPAVAAAPTGCSDALHDDILQQLAQMRLEFDQRLLGLTPARKQEMSQYAPLPVVKQMAVNFQTAIEGLDSQMAAVRDFLKNLVSKNDLEAIMETLQPQIERTAGETAGGRIRCLLCGKAAASVTGMITESEIARILGTPPQSGAVRGSNGDAYVLAYGRDVLRTKQKPQRKAIVPAVKPPINLNSL